jgi:hypothetical protein
MTSEPSATSLAARRSRRALIGASAAVFIATPLELVLTEHTEETIQLLPFFGSGLGLACLGLGVWVRSLPRALTGTLLGVVAAIGALGMWEHFEHNLEFVREIKPNLDGGAAVTEALFGAGPALAPGILILGAFLAWSTLDAPPRKS